MHLPHDIKPYSGAMLSYGPSCDQLNTLIQHIFEKVTNSERICDLFTHESMEYR